MQTRVVSGNRSEGAGTGSFNLMPHISIFAENEELWPLLINLGRSYNYQFYRGRHSWYQRGWFVDMGFYLLVCDKLAIAPKYRFHSYANTHSSERRFFLLEVAFFTDWR